MFMCVCVSVSVIVLLPLNIIFRSIFHTYAQNLQFLDCKVTSNISQITEVILVKRMKYEQWCAFDYNKII